MLPEIAVRAAGAAGRSIELPIINNGNRDAVAMHVIDTWSFPQRCLIRL